MYQGNWKCSSCGGAITELPFEPRSESGLTCRTCFIKQKNKDTTQPPEMNISSEEVPYDIPDHAELASEPDFDDGFAGMDTVPATPVERPKFAGNWTCAGCGNAITSLPFQPRDTSNLKCLDCFKKSRA